VRRHCSEGYEMAGRTFLDQVAKGNIKLLIGE
jgi:hypothetical protein